MRFVPGNALLARTVRDGAIGEPRMVTLLLHIPLLADPASEVPSWWSDAEQGGGWLGAHAPHAIDQVRATVGDFARVSASLPRAAGHSWTVEDSYIVHFETANGAAGVMQATAVDRGPMLFATRVTGTRGTAWAEGDRVVVATADAQRDIEMPRELRVEAPQPPPSDLLVTAYDLLHSTGLDYGPYLRLVERFRDRILGADTTDATDAGEPRDPQLPTFADGVAQMDVLDAVRASAARHATVTVGPLGA
jgi:predicted dehydrogenase